MAVSDNGRNIRRLPAPDDGEGRVETGAVKFGDDWPGLFVRGDDAGPLFVAWQSVKARLTPRPRAVEVVLDPLRRIMDIIRDDVDCGDTCARFEAGVKQFNQRMAQNPPPFVGTPEVIGTLWWSCRTLPMTWAGQHGYDPVARIRAGEKRHTVRGNPYKPGTILQVTANSATRQGKKRIPLWLRVTACEPVDHEDMATDEFALADGFRPDDDDPRSPKQLMWDFMQEYVPRREAWEEGDVLTGLSAEPLGEYSSACLIHFEVMRDEMGGDGGE